MGSVSSSSLLGEEVLGCDAAGVASTLDDVLIANRAVSCTDNFLGVDDEISVVFFESGVV